jgi:hypothetical protein
LAHAHGLEHVATKALEIEIGAWRSIPGISRAGMGRQIKVIDMDDLDAGADRREAARERALAGTAGAVDGDQHRFDVLEFFQPARGEREVGEKRIGHGSSPPASHDALRCARKMARKALRAPRAVDWAHASRLARLRR